MKRVLISGIFFLSVTTSILAAESGVIVTVTEVISGRTDDQVRHGARVKAAFSGINHLPVVIKGDEKLTEEEYKGYIHALGAGYVNVQTKNEVWNRESGLLELYATVSLDERKVAEALGRITENEHTKKLLRQSYLKMEAIIKESMIDDVKMTGLLMDQKMIFASSNIRMTVQESIAAKERMVKAMAAALRAKMQEKLAGFKIEILDASNDGLKVIARGDGVIRASEVFTSKVLLDFYDINKKLVDERAGVICLQALRYSWRLGNEPASPHEYKNNIEGVINIYSHFNIYKNHDRKREDKANFTVLKLNVHPVNEITLVTDSYSYDNAYYDMVLASPSDFLQVGICI